MKTSTLQPKPFMCGDEERFESLGAQVCLQANAEQTGGAFAMFDAVCPPGFTTPLHIHYTEDVAILVLEGALTFFGVMKNVRWAQVRFYFNPKVHRMDSV